MEQTERSTDQGSMNQDFFSAKWQQMRGTLRAWWGKLTDDDWERIGGQKDRLIGMLQEKYGYAKEMALREVDRRFNEYGGTVRTTGQEIKNAGQDIAQSAANAYGDAQSKVQEVSSAAAEKMGDATKTVGEQMSSLAGTIRDNAPQEGVIGSAAKTVANQLDDAGAYLQDNTFDNMARDISGLVRRYPMQSLLIGLGIGYLFSQRSKR
jgi:uncharacterized protein YjbJ (UPF0337 family)